MTPAPRGPAKYWLTGRRAQRSTPRLEQNTYFRERRQSNVSGRHCLAGDTVLIAPVSMQIRC